MAVSRIGVDLVDAMTAMTAAINPLNNVKGNASFGSVLTKASGGDRNNAGMTESGNTGAKQNFAQSMEEAGKALKNTGKPEVGGKDVKEKTLGNDNGEERIGNALDKAVDEVKEVIKEELGITDEELEEAMETLNLTAIDLLDISNVAAIVAEITDSEVSDIITDENLTANVINITSSIREITAELIEEINVSPEMFKDMLESGELTAIPEEPVEEFTQMQSPELPEADGEKVNQFRDYIRTEEKDLTVKTEDGKKAEAKEEVSEEHSENLKEIDSQEKFKVTVSEEKDTTAGTRTETVSISTEPDRADRQPTTGGDKSEISTPDKNEAGIEKPVEETVEKKGTEGRESGQNFSRQGSENKGQSINLLFQNNLTDAITEAVEGTDTAAASEAANQMSTAERVEDILNQVKEEINISVRQESASMELQLNPASLGKVGLHIETKAGSVTAQFVAENAQVKQALESQISELKETLLNKGIRIEDVEVTIASHAFEQNFMNNGGNGAGNFSESAEGARRSARLRRINLMGAQEEAEEISEEDELARRIMIDSGNSVDYSA